MTMHPTCNTRLESTTGVYLLKHKSFFILREFWVKLKSSHLLANKSSKTEPFIQQRFSYSGRRPSLRYILHRRLIAFKETALCGLVSIESSSILFVVCWVDIDCNCRRHVKSHVFQLQSSCPESQLAPHPHLHNNNFNLPININLNCDRI